MTTQEWRLYGKSWFQQMDNIFNIDRYLSVIFLADDRVEAARRAVETFDQHTVVGDAFAARDGGPHRAATFARAPSEMSKLWMLITASLRRPAEER